MLCRIGDWFVSMCDGIFLFRKSNFSWCGKKSCAQRAYGSISGSDPAINIYGNSQSYAHSIFTLYGKVGVSSMKISHEVASCPIGFFGKTELGKNLPCRLSHFTQHDYMRYQSGIPYISKLSESYSK